MSLANQGRNAIAFNNSASKTLLENWVEERGVGETLGKDSRPPAQRFRDGHHGLLTTTTAAGPMTTGQVSAAPNVGEEGTTTGRSFTHQVQAHPPTVGRRRQQLVEQVRAYVTADVEAEEREPEPEMELSSTMHADYTSDYVAKVTESARPHDVYGEAAASFWQEELTRGRALPGMTDTGSRDSPFKKNATFSTPVEHALDGSDR